MYIVRETIPAGLKGDIGFKISSLKDLPIFEINQKRMAAATY
jgi:hypothetical protein